MSHILSEELKDELGVKRSTSPLGRRRSSYFHGKGKERPEVEGISQEERTGKEEAEQVHGKATHIYPLLPGEEVEGREAKLNNEQFAGQ